MWGFCVPKACGKSKKVCHLGPHRRAATAMGGNSHTPYWVCLACLTFQSQAVVTGEPLWASHMEFSSWSLTQFLAIIQSLWVRLWNSRKVRRERGLLKLEGARFPAA